MDHGRAAGLPLALVDAAALAYFAILVGAPLVLYPLLFARSVAPLVRVVGALLPTGVWWLGEVAFRARVHPLDEAVVLASSPVNLIHLELLVLELALADLACRIWRRRGGTAGFRLGWSALRLAAALACLGGTLAVGVPLFLGYQGLDRALFPRDLPPLSGGPPRSPAPDAGAPMPPPKALPNLIVILSDDHRDDTAGYAGHPFVETPALDRLAAEGVRFRNSFVTTSLCSPSRASLLTGQFPERHGVFDNFTPWNDDNRTFFESLAPAGYRTAFIGKWHMPGELPALRGVDHFVTFTALGGQGRYLDCPLVVDGRETPSRRRYIAEELTDRALAFVEAHRDEPFALLLSHKNVHAPFVPDEREAGRYAEAPVELPPDAPHRWAGATRGQYVHLNPLPIDTAVRRYGEAVASMDREIARLLDALDRLDLAQRTLVVYTSDNGYLWGEHGFVDKRWAYEESIRVPLLLRYPPLTGTGSRVVDALVLNVDLAPTLLAVAGVAVPSEMQGRSLVPLLRDPEAPWRDAFLYRYFFEAPYPVPAHEAVRTNRYKLVRYAHGEVDLFDLARDPAERRDLAGEPSTRALRDALLHRLDELRAER